jgi:predicted cobalt transporter CbtA
LGTILKAALIAGLAAGLTVAIFHLLVTEPLIDRAIMLEDQAQHSQGAHAEPVVSRDMQHRGLVLGYLLYGLTWAVFFGVTYRVAQRWLPRTHRLAGGLILAALGYWAFALLPFLKYPANPPGIGDPDTIGTRQALYLGFLVLSVVGTALAVWIGRTVQQKYRSSGPAWMPVAALIVAFGLLLYAAMPATAEEIHLPADLVNNFRTLSLTGLTLFWIVLGLLFAKLVGSARPT